MQVKNGPIDFQPREPFSPMFGTMPRTPLGIEFQITQEYLGFATHMVYEAPIFKECLEADTYAKGAKSTVATVVDGSLHDYQKTLMAGVANAGSARNWTGHPMAQANWYAFGRLAWDHTVSSEAIAGEWVKMTLTNEPKAVKRIVSLMMKSREIYVDYNTPMGLSTGGGRGIGFDIARCMVGAGATVLIRGRREQLRSRPLCHRRTAVSRRRQLN